MHNLNNYKIFFLACLFSAVCFKADAQEQAVQPIHLSKSGKLVYAKDSLGNRIPDYSYSGYMAGEKAIPEAVVKVVVPFKEGDATLRIQSALDHVAKLPLDKNGLRGAVLLQKGVYQVNGSLKINNSGVVLRGSGTGQDGTTILGAGTIRDNLIEILGSDHKNLEKAVNVASEYVPVNAMELPVADVAAFKVGDHIQIHRPATQAWIDLLGTDHFGGGITALGWKPGRRELYWDRTVTGIKGNVLTIDAPLTTALDKKLGQATVSKYSWIGRIGQVGIENLSLESTFDKNNIKDEAHRWMAISIENVKDAWVRQVNFKHFAGSAVFVQSSARRVTVEDCKSLEPVSEIGGERRYTFYTKGQQTLFQRCYSQYGYHDFAVGFMAAGPNAFVECRAELPYSFSGGIDSWASGVLFDVVNIDGNALSYKNRGQDGQGAGWSAANSMFWQCSAARIDNFQPPTAQNWAYGCWAQFSGDGFWDMSNEHVNPRSLYYAQLKDRLGEQVESRTFLMPVESEASSSPSVETALELTKLAVNPAPLLTDFIDAAPERNAISTSFPKGVKTIDQIGVEAPGTPMLAPAMEVKNGWLARGAVVLSGMRQDVQWWTGSSRDYYLPQSRDHITRFVPGETGKGLTDNLDTVINHMKQNHVLAIDHNYGLWYERRRDDHERIRRMDGEVWPPFYELPFARSGQGTAWDGLSKYDLTKYNSFYWGRLKQFADLADQNGLALIHENYFQHNIIEAGAHYADFPWRPANNINNTGFPEPVPYAGDKRLFLAEQFYDINHPVRRALHRQYIRQCLDNFKENSGVIQLISAEYTGPLHFVEFWLDVIKEWEDETGKHPIIGLSATKDVQDAILADKKRAAVVDLIDIQYWYYQENGEAYAPKGGQNLAPRQHARVTKSKGTSFEQVYRAVNEYRMANSGKAVTYSANSFDRQAWAVFMAGGSIANLPEMENKAFLSAAYEMQPVKSSASGEYRLQGEKGMIIYKTTDAKTAVTLSKGSYEVCVINPSNGKNIKTYKVKGGQMVDLDGADKGSSVLFVSKK